LEGEDKTTDNSEKEKPIDIVESSAVESGNVIILNVQASSELKKDDSENKQNTAEEKANNKEENSNIKSKEIANENKRSNGNDGVIVPDDGNNNAGNTDSAKNKHSARRARFSSEITIQPKAYFQAGTETVVMMVCMYGSLVLYCNVATFIVGIGRNR
jgi:hypothetical protein